MDANITDATAEDVLEILALQKLAYQSEAEIYRNHDLPPLTESEAEIRDEFYHRQFLKAVVDNRLIGSVRAFSDGHTCFISRLVVHPDFQRRGIGTALMDAVERRFAAVHRYELSTGYRSAFNLHFYERRGYVVFREQDSDLGPTLMYLEKPAAARTIGSGNF